MTKEEYMIVIRALEQGKSLSEELDGPYDLPLFEKALNAVISQGYTESK